MNFGAMESRLVDDWKKAWKFLSVWAFILIGIAPDLHTAVVSMGWLDDPETPAGLTWTLRGLAIAGIAFRLVKQNKPKAKDNE